MTPDVRADAEQPTLEELLERGKVQSALILKGKFSRRELELIKTGWEKAHEVNRAERDRLLSRLDTLERESEEFCRWHSAELERREAAEARLRAAEEARDAVDRDLAEAMYQLSNADPVRWRLLKQSQAHRRAALAGVQAPAGEDTP